MIFKNKIKIVLLLLCDIAFLYLALFATIIIRYGADFYVHFVETHFFPFTIIFLPWIVIFYVAGLYDLRQLRNNIDFLKVLGLAIFVSAIVAVFLFYLVPFFGITPKTNLFVFMLVFAFVEVLWRRSFNRLIASGQAPIKVLLVGSGKITDTVYRHVTANRQLGYEVKARLTPEEMHAEPKRLHDGALTEQINLVVVPREIKYDAKLNKVLYELFGRGIAVWDIVNFYEAVMKKIPLAGLEESWFLDNLINQQKFYDQLKRAVEFLSALVLGVVLAPFLALIAIVIKLTSPGPAIYQQLRVGKNGAHFTLHKFRTMRENAEQRGVQWADPNDLRATAFGKLLRYTHVDEFPQLLNILRNEISFVGPRPERPEFIDTLREKIPYYETRLLVRPGITGWAQINYRYGASVEDAHEKLEYDIYYIKNRSIILDIAIILKTLKSFFANQT
ncbi:MAG: hypothetical protein A2945_00330 [Candidatus Liptonbacteria bacterium RIFCSPLOWO2_01_FULL_52_25]|uniref:Bacterial sugar transferase domain-containing protein n=1 Tax=Candidatus Liptonbacteria bacterium RIFCSPLOWO2_01_FULL_52_25 TaxID=1798650 RepID=A0A1G2CFF4_9BACT|nr:MAG: hypothetical protein A2945_00330 [Candidatus Liptonbacteria bacterium RIFCSPLOWO2_01_FULL_52_25]